MKRHHLLPLLAAPLLISGALLADSESLRRHVETLTAPPLEGRLTGSEGARRAADYLVSRLEELGAEPLPGHDSFRVPFEFTAGTRDQGTTLEVDGRVFSAPEQVLALSFSESATVSGPVVFAGYGLRVPDGQGESYDSYAGLDVEGKVVLVLRYFPEEVEPDRRATLARYSALRFKAMLAREAGAAALLVATGPRSAHAGELVPMTSDTASAGSGLPAASISGEVAAALFGATGRSLEEAQAALDDGSTDMPGFELPGVQVELETEVARERRTGHNVVALLPGGSDALPEPWVVIGGHYDHLGHGNDGNSLARGDEIGQIHPGADDNASGVAAVLEIGRRLNLQLADREPRRRVVLAFWSGEELGALGSDAFVEEKVLPPDRVAAYLNFDMVGRSRDNRLIVQGVGSSPAWPGILERANVPVGFALTLQRDPWLPTDSISFNAADVPSLTFFTGSHSEYHRPADTAATLAYDELERVVRLGTLVARRLVELEQAPEFVEVEREAGEGGRASVRIYTGTIPDYATEVEGLLLGGVVPGGPAEEAGLREGDVVVEFGGQTITNVYDYMYALEAAKIDQPVQVVVLRDGERLTVTLVPRARD